MFKFFSRNRREFPVDVGEFWVACAKGDLKVIRLWLQSQRYRDSLQDILDTWAWTESDEKWYGDVHRQAAGDPLRGALLLAITYRQKKVYKVLLKDPEVKVRLLMEKEDAEWVYYESKHPKLYSEHLVEQFQKSARPTVLKAEPISSVEDIIGHRIFWALGPLGPAGKSR